MRNRALPASVDEHKEVNEAIYRALMRLADDWEYQGNKADMVRAKARKIKRDLDFQLTKRVRVS